MIKATEKPHDDPRSQNEEDTGDDQIIAVALKWSLVAVMGIAIVAGAITAVLYWPQENVVDTNFEAVVLPEVDNPPELPIPVVPFRDITVAAGINFHHENGALNEKLLPETMGSGCAFLDYDNDHDQDLLLVNGNRWPWDQRPAVTTTMRLYQNDGTGRFTDVTNEAGLAVSLYGMGVAVGDIDNDGDPDLFVTAVGSNVLLQNNGGRFEDVTDEAGVAGEAHRWSTCCTFFDYDRDGRLDLFVGNYVEWSREIDLRQNFTLDGESRAYGPPGDFGGTFAYLYHNEGQGRFRDVSTSTGIRITNPATGVPVAKALGVAACDVDRDGWMDLVIANDTVQNFLFHNQQGQQFAEIGAAAAVAYDVNGEARGAMGIDAAYFRDPETLGVVVGNFANEMTALYVKDPAVNLFYDSAVSTGLGPPTRLKLTFGVFFFDYDLDGRLDVFSANGHLEQEINKVQARQYYQQPPQLFWNAGLESEWEFVEVPAKCCGDDLLVPLVGRGAAYADIDGDGDLDLLITNSGGAPRLLRNETQLAHHWLRVQLQGTACNRDAIGAEVDLAAGGRVQRRQVNRTRGYLSQVEPAITFGLGDQTLVDRMTVRWPDGTEQVVPVAGVDREITVVQQQTTD